LPSLPAASQTADNWGTDPNVCMYPGFGNDPLFITSSGVIAPTNYPITYDAKGTCNMAIVEQDLADSTNPLMIYAKLFAFKDYSDNLYVTVSMNASGFLAGQTGNSNGQFLLPNPSINSDPSGLVFVGSTFPNGQTIVEYAQYTTAQTLSSSVGQYSCFTVMIPLRQACPFSTSTYVRGFGTSPSYCASRTTGAAVATVDLSSTTNLFFSAQFNVSNYDTTATSCGAQPSTFTKIGIPGVLDLYGAIPNTMSLTRNCASITVQGPTVASAYSVTLFQMCANGTCIDDAAARFGGTPAGNGFSAGYPMTAAPGAINLGAAHGFAALGGGAILNAGGSKSTFYGDVGNTITGSFDLVGGSVKASSVDSAAGRTAVTTAYADAAGRATTTASLASTDLAGVTLTPGVHKSTTGLSIGVGTLTLDGGGDAKSVFIIQATTTLITAANSKVKLTNSANANNVFWLVGSTASFGDDSIFHGTILAATTITVGSGASVHGRLLAGNAVTFAGGATVGP
jgi:hypothetical protein